uniref:CSON001421 protein n=1 Tax=Culicoides sonorensis TaxID=179676 RepID=A0A336MKZ4_CULSO
MTFLLVFVPLYLAFLTTSYTTKQSRVIREVHCPSIYRSLSSCMDVYIEFRHNLHNFLLISTNHQLGTEIYDFNSKHLIYGTFKPRNKQ